MGSGVSGFKRGVTKLTLLSFVAYWVCAVAAQAQNGEWVWMRGSSTVPSGCPSPIGCGQPGVYGTEGSGATGNLPGGRYAAGTWSDASGNFWLYAGNGNDANGAYGPMDDLWKLDVATGQWAWTGGSNLLSAEPPSVGTLGVAAASNTPGSRNYANNWTDSSGNLWLFAGAGGNDLWKLQLSNTEWTWVGGINPVSPGTSNGAGIYGILGVPGFSTWPGTRSLAASCTAPGGDLWLFGGYGRDAVANGGMLNDLWVYDPTPGEWAWMSGSTTVLPPGYSGGSAGGPNPVYGTQGVPAPGNTPGGRQSGVCWFDTGGNLWLFGGYGQHLGPVAYLNDMWEFNPTTMEWTWMSGIDALPDCSPTSTYVCGNPGVYGTLGLPAPGNLPGARISTTTWTDLAGNLWLFGGLGYDENDDYGELNDLWEFSPLSRQWTWQGGGNTAVGNCVSPVDSPICGSAGIYGTKGVADVANTPGGRDSAMGWTDGSGNLWLFGGEGFDGSGHYGDLNDLWMMQEASSVLPATAVPQFSLPSGTYSSPQTVTISDATAGATIYYSTDGTPPTLSSQVYAGPLNITSTEAIEAVAVGGGNAVSRIASGNYLLPPGFTLGVSPASLSVNGGATATATLTVTPQNGFNSAVSFECSGLPAGASGTFSPLTVTPSGSAVTTTLTITTPANTAAKLGFSSRFSMTAVALSMCWFSWRRRHRLLLYVALGVAVLGTGVVSGCGGGTGDGKSSAGATPVTSTVTVTATSGLLQQSATISLTVN